LPGADPAPAAAPSAPDARRFPAFDQLLQSQQDASSADGDAIAGATGPADVPPDGPLPDVQRSDRRSADMPASAAQDVGIPTDDIERAADEQTLPGAMSFVAHLLHSRFARHHASDRDARTRVTEDEKGGDDAQGAPGQIVAVVPVQTPTQPPVRDAHPLASGTGPGETDLDALSSASADVDPEGRRTGAAAHAANRTWVPDWSGSDAVAPEDDPLHGSAQKTGAAGNTGLARAAKGAFFDRRQAAAAADPQTAAMPGLSTKPSLASPDPDAGQPPVDPTQVRSDAALTIRALFAGRAAHDVPPSTRDTRLSPTIPTDTAATPPGPTGATTAPAPVASDVRAAVHADPAFDRLPPDAVAAFDRRSDNPHTSQAASIVALAAAAAPLMPGDAAGMRALPATHDTREPLPLPDDDSMASQIVQRMRLQWLGGQGTAVVTLDPEYLGTVTVQLHVGRDGATTATLSADNPDVRTWMQSHEPLLKQQLANQGLSLDRLDVVHEEARGTGDAPEGRRQRWRAPAAPSARRRSDEVFRVVV
jgi:hypothetical protein